LNYFAITRSSGPAVIAATESVNAKATTSNTSLPSTATTTLVFSSKSWDTHNAYSTSTGQYTIPVSGKYQIAGAFHTGTTGSLTVSQEITLIANQSGSASNTSAVGRFTAQSTSAVDASASGSTLFSCLAGDLIWLTVYNGTGNTITLSNTATDNFITITRIGN
jgi:hypothetical protein